MGGGLGVVFQCECQVLEINLIKVPLKHLKMNNDKVFQLKLHFKIQSYTKRPSREDHFSDLQSPTENTKSILLFSFVFATHCRHLDLN